MPVVPTYEPRVREQALEGGFQRAPDVGRGLMQAGEAMTRVADVADRIDLRDAQAKAFDAEAKITSEWLNWDAQARRKYRGQNVDGYAQAAEEWWAKAAETYGKELDPRARALVSKSLAEKRLQAINSVGTFINAEKERFADEAYAADVATTIQFGVTSGDVASAAQQIREKAAILGARKGWTTEQVQAEALKNLSAMHLAQITKLAESNAEAAQAYYDANKAEVDFAHQARIEQVIKAEADNQFAAQFAASVANKPLGDQLAEAAKITDPARREKTLIQIRNNYALVKQAEQERENAAAAQAWQLFAQGKKIPEEILSQMFWRDRVQLQEAQRTRAERLAAGRSVKTDPVRLAELLDMARDNPEEFKRLRLATLTEQIGSSDLEQLARLQRDMLSPDKEQGAITTLQAISIYTRDMDKSTAALFQSEALNAIDRFQIEKKRPPTIEERRKILDDLVVEGVIERRFWFDTTKRRFEMTPEERARATFPRATPQASQFTVGQVYRDAKGNRAKYLGNGKWEPVK
jgi:hypothetical protein